MEEKFYRMHNGFDVYYVLKDGVISGFTIGNHGEIFKTATDAYNAIDKAKKNRKNKKEIK